MTCGFRRKFDRRSDDWRPNRHSPDRLSPTVYSRSVVTVIGERTRTVMFVPGGRTASLRSPAITVAVPPPAPAAAPIAAPLPPPRMAPRIAPTAAPPPTFAALLFAGDSPSR